VVTTAHIGNVSAAKVHPLEEPGYVIPTVGNLTEENSWASMSEFLIDMKSMLQIRLGNFITMT
jgi:hypothetical protein